MKWLTQLEIPEYLKHGLDKYKYVLLICTIGLVLLLLPFGGADSQPELLEGTEPDAYKQTAQLEQQLENMFQHMEGVGRIEVLLTIKSGYEAVYAYDEAKSANKSQTGAASSLESTLITVSENGRQTPVTVKTNYPVFLGAVVICDGGDNAKIRLELTEAIRSLTGITADNIQISKMKQ